MLHAVLQIITFDTGLCFRIPYDLCTYFCICVGLLFRHTARSGKGIIKNCFAFQWCSVIAVNCNVALPSERVGRRRRSCVSYPWAGTLTRQGQTTLPATPTLLTYSNAGKASKFHISWEGHERFIIYIYCLFHVSLQSI